MTSILFVSICFSNNYSKILILKNDFTAENFGRDILASAPQNAILNLHDDTSYYNTLYVRYVLNERSDIKIVIFGKLKNKYYQENLHINYPEIYLPPINLSDEEFLKSFLETNAQKFAVLNSGPSALVQTTWFPSGLLWKYYSEKTQLPDPNILIRDNLALWVSYHSPLSSSLGTYQSLLLSDVLRVYALGHQSFGMMLFNNEQFTLAENEFKSAILYWPDNKDNYIQLAQIYLKSSSCDKAKETLTKAQTIDSSDTDITKFFIDLYANCYKQPEKADEYSIKYQQLKKTENKTQL